MAKEFFAQNYYPDPDPDDPYNLENSYGIGGEELKGEESYLRKQARVLKERSLELAKRKAKEGVKRVGKKVAKKAGKALAKKGAKIAAKVAAKRGAQAALSATGYGAIAAAVIEGLDRAKQVIAWMGKQFGVKIGWKEIGLALLASLILPQFIFLLGLVILVLIVIVGICKIPGLDLLLRDVCGGLGI